MVLDLLTLWITFSLVHWCKCMECQHDLELVDFKRSIINQGFHRHVSTTIEWKSQANCSLLFQESLPASMFVDLDQVSSHPFQIRSSSKIDIEQPAHKAAGQVLWIYPSQEQYSSIGKDYHSSSISLPVHLRYHRPSSNGKTFERVSLRHPRILYKCYGETKQHSGCKVVDAACLGCGESMCRWIEISKKLKHDVSTLVPVGDLGHGPAVTVSTLLCTAQATLWTLLVIVKN